MRFTYHIRKEKIIQRTVFEALKKGMAKLGDELVEMGWFEGVPPDVDGTVVTGIGRHELPGRDARTVFDQYHWHGKHVLFFDKGYTRQDVFRASINSFQPLEYLDAVVRPHDRLKAAGMMPLPYLGGGKYILVDGASQKYCDWWGLGDLEQFGRRVIMEIRKRTADPIIYRPRPILHGSVRIDDLPNVWTSDISLRGDLARAKLVVSHGGNLGFDAVMAGIPHFALDVSIARPMSETRWSCFNRYRHVPTNERLQWAANVLYNQWSERELADGTAWAVMKNMIEFGFAKWPAPCPVCENQGIENVYGGNGTVLEVPCSQCFRA